MVHNFGTLDIKIEGGAKKNIHYGFWSRMIERCYSKKSLDRHPTYIGVGVCDEWRNFSSFYEWSLKNYIDGSVLDKDLSSLSGDKYCPERCCYIPQELNKAVLDSFSARGDLPLGVWRKQPSKRMVNERTKPYIAELNNKKLGSFATVKEAHACWQRAKIAHLLSLADKYKNIVDRKAIDGLMLRVEIINNHLMNNIQTNSVSRI